MTHTARLYPLLAPIVGRLIGVGEQEVDVLQPEEVEVVRPPACLAGMLDRVSGTDEHSVVTDHLTAACETKVTHAPVLRFTYRNALVRRSGFATWRKAERYGADRRLRELGSPLLGVPKVRYCHSYVSWRYFGHWLTDAALSAMIDQDRGALWMPPNPDWGHAADYLGALDLSVISAPLVYANRLTVYQDFGQGSHKQARYAVIRDRLHARFGDGDANDCVYLRRGRTGAPRWIANEQVLVDALVARNWRVLDIATTTMSELQRALCQARAVLSMDGSHIDHAHLSLRPGAVMVILMPHDRFSTRQLGPCRAHRVEPGLVVLTGTREQGYHADLDEVLRTVDLAENASG